MSSSRFRRGKRRVDDDESTFLKRDRHRRRLPPADHLVTACAAWPGAATRTATCRPTTCWCTAAGWS